jgi:LPS sulfotransferase NodH
MPIRQHSMECAPATRPRRFLILFVRGSGSTWLMTLLNQQPNVFCGRETHLPETFFDPIAPDAPFSGYKNKLKHIPDWAARRILGERDVTMIFLYRRDIARHVIGLCRKNQLRPRRTHKAGKGNAWSPDHIVESGPVAIEAFQEELHYVREEADRLAAFQQQVRDAGIPTLTLYYEDMLGDPPAVTAEAFSWIAGSMNGFVVPVDIDGQVPVKNTSTDLHEVTNLDELHRYIVTQTDLSWFA